MLLSTPLNINVDFLGCRVSVRAGGWVAERFHSTWSSKKTLSVSLVLSNTSASANDVEANDSSSGKWMHENLLCDPNCKEERDGIVPHWARCFVRRHWTMRRREGWGILLRSTESSSYSLLSAGLFGLRVSMVLPLFDLSRLMGWLRASMGGDAPSTSGLQNNKQRR